MLDCRDKFKSRKFKNGLTVYSGYFDRPWAYLDVIVNGGLKREQKEGVSHFLEHIIAENFDLETNIFENAYTGLFSTYFYFFSFLKNINSNLLENVAQIIFEKQSKKEEIRRQKRVIYQEAKREENNLLERKVEKEKKKSLYPNKRITKLITGNPKEIKKIEKTDVDEFKLKYYIPENVYLVFAGGINSSKVFNMVSDTNFMLNKKGQVVKPLRPIKKPEPPKTKETIIRNSDYLKSTPNDFKIIGKVTKFPGSYSEITIDILEDILRFSLQKKLRKEKGWVYSVDVATVNFGSIYEFNIHCGFNSISINKVDKAIYEVLKRAKKDRSFFEKQKSGYLNYLKLQDYEVFDACDMAKEDIQFYGKIRSSEKIKKEIEEVDFEEIRDLISLIEKESWNLFIVP